MNLGRSDKPIQGNALWSSQDFRFVLAVWKKPPSSAIGVVNEVCSRALVGSLTKPQNRATLFPSLKKGQGSQMVLDGLIFLTVRNRHLEATSLYLAAV